MVQAKKPEYEERSPESTELNLEKTTKRGTYESEHERILTHGHTKVSTLVTRTKQGPITQLYPRGPDHPYKKKDSDSHNGHAS